MATGVTIGIVLLSVFLSVVFVPGVRSAAIASFARIFCYRFDAYIMNNISNKILSLSGNDVTSGKFTSGFAAMAVHTDEDNEDTDCELMDNPNDPGAFIWIPGEGWNVASIQGKYCIIRFWTARSASYPEQISHNLEIFAPFWRNRRILEKFIADVLESLKSAKISRNNVQVYSTGDGEWSYEGEIQPRDPDSVVLPPGMMRDIIDDIRMFEREKEWYLDMGIPYSRGYLLSGPPGNGKSTIIRALASELRRDIRYIDLSNDGVPGDASLRRLLHRVDEDDIVVIEDVDCFFSGRKPARGVDVTFTGLLNVIDGLQAPPGRIIIVTTNHPENLDPALIRPGRLDVAIEISPPNRDEVRDMYLRFFPDQKLQAEQFANDREGLGLSMASIEGQLICHALGSKSIRWSSVGYRVSKSESVDALDSDVCSESGKA